MGATSTTAPRHRSSTATEDNRLVGRGRAVSLHRHARSPPHPRETCGWPVDSGGGAVEKWWRGSAPVEGRGQPSVYPHVASAEFVSHPASLLTYPQIRALYCFHHLINTYIKLLKKQQAAGDNACGRVQHGCRLMSRARVDLLVLAVRHPGLGRGAAAGARRATVRRPGVRCRRRVLPGGPGGSWDARGAPSGMAGAGTGSRLHGAAPGGSGGIRGSSPLGALGAGEGFAGAQGPGAVPRGAGGHGGPAAHTHGDAAAGWPGVGGAGATAEGGHGGDGGGAPAGRGGLLRGGGRSVGARVREGASRARRG